MLPRYRVTALLRAFRRILFSFHLPRQRKVWGRHEKRRGRFGGVEKKQYFCAVLREKQPKRREICPLTQETVLPRRKKTDRRDVELGTWNFEL